MLTNRGTAFPDGSHVRDDLGNLDLQGAPWTAVMKPQNWGGGGGGGGHTL